MSGWALAERGRGWEGEKHARQLFSSSCDPGLRSSRCLHLLPDFATEPSASLSLGLFNEQVDKKTDTMEQQVMLQEKVAEKIWDLRR